MAQPINHVVKKIAIECYLKGLNQKEIATQLEVSEKTVGVWLKEIKNDISKHNEQLKQLRLKLDELLNDSSSKSEDIKNITASISNLEKIRLTIR